MLSGELVGPDDVVVSKPLPADSDDEDGIAFVEDKKYAEVAERSNVRALLVGRDGSSSKPHIKVDDPRQAFGFLLACSIRPLPIEPGIHPTAVVHPSARVEVSASIGPYAVVERGARVGGRSHVHAFSYIGEACEMGEDCCIYPHVVLYQDVRLGDRCVVHSGTVLGADGFGYYWDGSRQVKVPQVGGVLIGSDVEIGANTAVDRSTAGDTVIGDDSKIDNLVQVAHNVKIGDHTVVAGQTGISGSVTIGNRVTIAGNVAFSDHVSVTDDVVLAGRSGVAKDIKEPGVYFGVPARPIMEATKGFLLATKLPELFDRLRALEREVEALKKDKS